MARGGRTPRPRHVPQRTCVACRGGSAKRELVRIVRAVDGSVVIDPTGKKSGRGAYLCRDRSCWEAGLKRSVLPRALKVEAIPASDMDALKSFAEGLEPSAPTRSAVS